MLQFYSGRRIVSRQADLAAQRFKRTRASKLFFSASTVLSSDLEERDWEIGAGAGSIAVARRMLQTEAVSYMAWPGRGTGREQGTWAESRWVALNVCLEI